MKTNIDRIRHEPPKIRIGKKGITEGIISEVEAILQIDHIVKVKCLKIVPTEGIKAIADNIAKLTHCNVVEIRGKTFILARKASSYS